MCFIYVFFSQTISKLLASTHSLHILPYLIYDDIVIETITNMHNHNTSGTTTLTLLVHSISMVAGNENPTRYWSGDLFFFFFFFPPFPCYFLNFRRAHRVCRWGWIFRRWVCLWTWIFVNLYLQTSAQRRQVCALATSPLVFGEWIVGDVGDRCWETRGGGEMFGVGVWCAGCFGRTWLKACMWNAFSRWSVFLSLSSVFLRVSRWASPRQKTTRCFCRSLASLIFRRQCDSGKMTEWLVYSHMIICRVSRQKMKQLYIFSFSFSYKHLISSQMGVNWRYSYLFDTM